jgi:hypothetical protein
MIEIDGPSAGADISAGGGSSPAAWDRRESLISHINQSLVHDIDEATRWNGLC